MGTLLLHFTYLHLTCYFFLSQQVPATTAALKKILDRIFERTGWEIKGVFTEEELADMIDAVVKEQPHMCVYI